MKKLAVLLAVLITTLVCFSGIVIALSTGLIQKNNIDISNTEQMTDDISLQYVQAQIDKGQLDIAENLKGKIMVSDNAVKEFSVTTPSKDFESYVDVGDYIKKGDSLYKNNQKVIVSPIDGRVITIQTGKSFYMAVFSYNDSSIIVDIPEKYQNEINKNLVIKATDENGEQVQLKIKGIQASVIDGKISVELENKFQLFKDSTVDVFIKFRRLSDCVIINKGFVKYDSAKKPFVQLLTEDNQIQNTYITIKNENKDFYDLENAEELIGKTVVMKKEELFMNDNGLQSDTEQ